jgi:hypothetical protein
MSDFVQVAGRRPIGTSRHLARFVVIHVTIAAVAFALWRTGAFGSLPLPDREEIFLLGCLVLYSIPGFIAVSQRNWAVVKHIGNGVPMWAICFTVLGLILTVASIKDMTPDSLTNAFRNIILALAPNLLGMLLMNWLRELAWWLGREEL